MLTVEDYQRVLSAIAALHDIYDLDELIEKMIVLSAELVGCNLVAFNEVNPERKRMNIVMKPQDRKPEMRPLQTAWEQNMDSHPILQYYLKTGDGSAKRISDFISLEEFHATPLYHGTYKHLNANYQIAIALPARKPLVIALAFNREHQDFTDREVEILNVLRPHFAQAYLTAEAVTVWREKSQRAQQTLEALDEGVLVVKGGQIATWTQKARLWLGEFFPGEARKARALPDAMVAWLRGLANRRGSMPLVVERNTARLVVRQVQEHGQTLLVMTRQDIAGSSEILQSLGLSVREAEVLMWVARGLANRDIAREMGISLRTVHKHLERVFAKLDVPGRTQAATKALAIWRH
jgi:DNA-binding CsgD family transcriptional regulator